MNKIKKNYYYYYGIIIIEGKDFNTFTGHEEDRILHIPKHTWSTQISYWGNSSSQSAEATLFNISRGIEW